MCLLLPSDPHYATGLLSEMLAAAPRERAASGKGAVAGVLLPGPRHPREEAPGLSAGVGGSVRRPAGRRSPRGTLAGQGRVR